MQTTSAESGTTPSADIPRKTVYASANTRKLQWRVFTSRVVFVGFLTVVAAVLGFSAYILLTQTERRLASEQFNSFTESALNSAQQIANRQMRGMVTLASVLEAAMPDAKAWPFVHLKNYKIIANNVIDIASGVLDTHMGFMPIVYPDQLAAFEDYAVNVVMKGNAANDRMFGMSASFQSYNETDGSTDWNSTNKIFTPFYQHSHNDDWFLMNWHSIEARGRLVDEMIECSKERALEMQLHVNDTDDGFIPRDCSLVTDIVDLNFQPVIETPAAVQVMPVYPANDPTKMTGLITTTINWGNTLLDVFSSEVSGVHCVLTTKTKTFTYEIERGQVKLT